MHYYTTAWMHYCSTVLLLYCITALLHSAQHCTEMQWTALHHLKYWVDGWRLAFSCTGGQMKKISHLPRDPSLERGPTLAHIVLQSLFIKYLCLLNLLKYVENCSWLTLRAGKKKGIFLFVRMTLHWLMPWTVSEHIKKYTAKFILKLLKAWKVEGFFRVENERKKNSSKSYFY